MYDDDFKDDSNVKSTGGSALKDFYEANKKLVWLLCGIIAFILILVIITKLSGPSNKTTQTQKVTAKIDGCKNYLTIGTTMQLNGSIVENNKNNAVLEWASSNPEAVTVDKKTGLVHGIKYGKATITLTSSDGNATSDVCEITVGNGNANIKVSSISVQNGEIVMNSNSTYKIPITITPSDGFIESIQYSSTNSNVATIDEEGIIHAKSIGDATISFKANNIYTGTIKVNVVSNSVTPQVVVKPDVINIKSKLIKLTVGESQDIDYDVYPANVNKGQLNWISSSSNIATVENGVLKAKNVGETIIKVCSMVGNVCSSSTVNVVAKEVVVDSVSISSSKVVTLNVGETQQISAMVTPSNATNKTLTYISANPSVVSVTNEGLMTALSIGSATIMIQSNNGKLDYVSVTVTGSTSGGTTTGGSTSGGSSGGSSTPSYKVTIKTSTENANSTYEHAINNSEKAPSTVEFIFNSKDVEYIKYCIRNDVTSGDKCNPQSSNFEIKKNNSSKIRTLTESKVYYVGYAAYDKDGDKIEERGWYIDLTDGSSSTQATNMDVKTYLAGSYAYQPRLTMKKNATQYFTVSFTPASADNDFSCVSDKTSIVEVKKSNNQCIATGKSVGQATITFKAVNNSSLVKTVIINVVN